jgi:hypothetical protein
MLGQRLLKFFGGVEFKMGDREIWRLAPGGVGDPLSNSQLTNPSGLSRETTSLWWLLK